MGRMPTRSVVGCRQPPARRRVASVLRRLASGDYPAELGQGLSHLHAPGDSGAAGVSTLRSRYADPLLILQLTTALVLFIACTNLASLVLARASARARVRRPTCGRRVVGSSGAAVMVENALIAVGRSDRWSRLRHAHRADRSSGCSEPSCRWICRRSPSDRLHARHRFARVDVRADSSLARLAGLRRRCHEGHRAESSSTREGTGLRRVLVIAQVACSLVLFFGGLMFHGDVAQPPGRGYRLRVATCDRHAWDFSA